jgi:heme-degrading monooxygenase HmoA
MRLAVGGSVDMNESFVALVIYPTTPLSQGGQADTLLRMVGPAIRTMPGFVGGQVFVSEDGASVVTLVEWRDRESYAQFRQSEFGRGATQLAADMRPRPYWLRPYATVER